MSSTGQIALLTQACEETMGHQTDKPRKEMNPGLLAAHAVRVAKMNGKTPLQIGAEKTQTALNWVYRWGWSSPFTVDMLGGSARRGLAARLVKNGLLRSTRTQSGGAVRGVPAQILTLTETGQAEVELTGKFGRQLDQFVCGCVHALVGNASQRPRFHRIAIVTDSPAIKKRYEQAFAPSARYQVWSKNSRGYWVSENNARTVSDNVKGRIQCQLIKD
jgi:hypothetical protein